MAAKKGGKKKAGKGKGDGKKKDGGGKKKEKKEKGGKAATFAEAPVSGSGSPCRLDGRECCAAATSRRGLFLFARPLARSPRQLLLLLLLNQPD